MTGVQTCALPIWERIYPLEKNFLDTLKYLKDKNALNDGVFSDETLQAVMQQAARELLLMEASDWQFVISTKGAIDYSTERFTGHADRLEALLDMAWRYTDGHGLTEEDTELLEETIVQDRPFEYLDLRWWSEDYLS